MKNILKFQTNLFASKDIYLRNALMSRNTIGENIFSYYTEVVYSLVSIAQIVFSSKRIHKNERTLQK